MKKTNTDPREGFLAFSVAALWEGEMRGILLSLYVVSCIHTIHDMVQTSGKTAKSYLRPDFS